MLDNFLQSGVLIMIVLFQPTSAARSRASAAASSRASRSARTQILEEVVRAAPGRSRSKRVGALIVLERETQLDGPDRDGHARSTPAVTKDLLVSIFLPVLAAARRRGGDPERPHRVRGLHPAAHAARGPAGGRRHAPPRGGRHHRGDRRGGDRRVRGDRRHLGRARRRDGAGASTRRACARVLRDILDGERSTCATCRPPSCAVDAEPAGDAPRRAAGARTRSLRAAG